MTRPLSVGAARLILLLPVIGTCVVSLVLLRAELVQVPYLNDSAVHEQMARVALADFRAGRFPPGSWFPYLNLGSPQFLHYQPLAAMLTALLGWMIGVARAFTVTTWLLVSCWPICVYAAARIFGLRRGAAVAAAMLSPFVSSATGVGYEQISYLWSGYGLYSQLFAMWTLPLAWAFSWRAVDEGRFVIPAAVFVAATMVTHFETGYLAVLAVVVFVVVRPTRLVQRAGRGLLVVAGAVTMAAWVIVPLVAQGKWAAINQFLQSGPDGVDANSYGARRVLTWLVEGDLFDWHHFALVTPLLAVGLCACILVWGRPRSDGPIGAGLSRALPLLFVVCLVSYFGRPTLGVLLDILPGAKDLFLRRFLVGVQLAGLLIAGFGAARLASWIAVGVRRASERVAIGGHQHRLASVFVVVMIALGVLIPVWSFAVSTADQDASFVSEQVSARGPTSELNSLIATITSRGGGRTFAGDPSDWGANFTVGQVPVFKYLASLDVDEVGFTLRTASLMSDAESEFDDSNPADYALFGIRWLLMPAGIAPAVPANLVEIRGTYALWEIPSNGYVEVIDTQASVAANSSDLGSFAGVLLSGLSPTDPVYPTVAYQGGSPPPPTLPTGLRPSNRPGTVSEVRANLADGNVVAKVSVKRRAVVLLSASYDPGWHVLVDGRPAATEMIAPAVVGVRVPPGVHTVRFVYRGFPDYPQLLLLGAVGLLVLVSIEVRRSRQLRAHRVDRA